MKINRFHIIIAIGLITIIGVIILQLVLINNAYKLAKTETDERIFFALQDVLVKSTQTNNSMLLPNNQVIKKKEGVYLVNLNVEFEPGIIDHFLQEEFKKIKLDLDYNYAMYNCSSNEMINGKNVNSTGTVKALPNNIQFEKDPNYTYYFIIQFPNIESSYIKNLSQYWFFTAVLLLVLIIYVYTIFIFLKQKQYTELQKDFINNMTHEFKTPLSSILLASQYLKNQREIQENTKLLKYNSLIEQQTLKLNQHIEQILYVAQSDAKGFQLDKKKFQLNTILELIKDNCQLKHSDNVSIKITGDTNLKLNADEFHFYNIIYNLVDNAIKYSTLPTEISILVAKEKNKIKLQFIDSGLGIPEKDLPFIFDKFYRVSRTDAKKIEGFGIGLSYVKKICDWHNWSIYITNNKEKGVTVTIEIPSKDYE